MQTHLPDPVATAWRAEGLTPPPVLSAVAESDFAEIAQTLAIGEGYTLPPSGSFDAAALRQDMTRRAAGGWLLGLTVRGAASGPLIAFLIYLTRNKLRETYPEGDILARLPNDDFPPDGRFVHVYDLWVSPQWRRRGLAAALKRAMEAHARALDFACLLTFTEATNAAVRHMNMQLGYRAIYEGPMWDEVPRVALMKRLG